MLNGIAEGHVVITYSPDGPFATLQCGEYGIGDEVPYGHADHKVVVQLDELIPGDRIRLYSERGLEEETSVDSDGGVTLMVNAMHRRFLRAEIWRNLDLADGLSMAAVTNPIYFASKKKRNHRITRVKALIIHHRYVKAGKYHAFTKSSLYPEKPG